MSDATDVLPDAGDDIPTAPFWMSTFSDMMTLLMTFFVMIVGMSEIKIDKFEQALSHFQGGSGVLQHQPAARPAPNAAAGAEHARSRRQDQRYEQFATYLEENDLTDKVEARRTENGVHVIIADSVMFRTGQARLIEPSRAVLRALSELLAGTGVGSVVVEGHTDDRPIQTGRFPSNWELSTARAASAVRFLQEHTPALDAARYAAVGYGAHHPRDTTSTRAARAHNRRVEILLDWRSWDDRKTTKHPPKRPLPRP